MLSDNLGARSAHENRTEKVLAFALVLVLALLLWQGDRMWDHLSGAPRGDELLFCASGQGDLSGIERALQQGADINARSTAELTPLMIACDSGGKPASVKLLLDRGADPKLQALAGVSALYNAVVGDSEEIVDMLIRAGADPNYQVNGETMLDIAIRLDRCGAARALRAHGGRSANGTGLIASSFAASK